jgi:hypothetical protein
MRYTREDVIRVLSRTEWKSAVNISRELYRMKNTELSNSWLYMTLYALRDEGMVDVREGNNLEILSLRGGRKYLEFRLCNDGGTEENSSRRED